MATFYRLEVVALLLTLASGARKRSAAVPESAVDLATAAPSMDSEKTIRSYCSDGSGLSSWQAYVCSAIGNNAVDPTCWPQRRYSRCRAGAAHGVVAFFHGYTACPDAYNEMAEVLQDACLHVYSFLSPGHGHPLVLGAAGGPGVYGRFNLTGLPTTRQPYIDFAEHAAAIISEEITTIRFTARPVVASIGLSLGAPIATVAAVHTSVFTHMVLMSPFFGVTSSGVDDVLAPISQCLKSQPKETQILSCLCAALDAFDGLEALDGTARQQLCGYVQWYSETSLPDVEWTVQTAQVALRAALEWAAENYDKVPKPFRPLFDIVIGWGAKCNDDIDSFGRGGFCDFQVQHLLAAHSLGQYAVRETYSPRRALQVFISAVERDGRTRNGLAFEALRALQSRGSTVGSCVWLQERDCPSDSPGNICGVPHSSASTSDNLGAEPFNLYWGSTLRFGVADVLARGQLPPPRKWNVAKWDGSRNMCILQDVDDPDLSLVAEIPTWTCTPSASRTKCGSVQ